MVRDGLDGPQKYGLARPPDHEGLGAKDRLEWFAETF